MRITAPVGEAGIDVTHISVTAYMAEMRHLEHIRNEALAHHDASALTAIRLQLAWLNRAFWGHKLGF